MPIKNTTAICRGVFDRQLVDKPGSVMNDHLSSPIITHRIKRVKRPTGGPPFIVDLLAADRVYLLRASPRVAASSYLAPFTLTS